MIETFAIAFSSSLAATEESEQRLRNAMDAAAFDHALSSLRLDLETARHLECVREAEAESADPAPARAFVAHHST